MILNRCRSVGFGPGHIPMSEIKSYLDLFPYPDVSEFVTVVKELDAAYLKWHDDHPKGN